MIHKIAVTDDVQIVFSHEEPGYADVLETFSDAEFVDVATFNLSSHDDKLVRRLRDLTEDVQVRIVTNLPNRFETYFGSAPKRKFQEVFAKYRALLDPAKFKSKRSSFFNIENHSKIVITDKLAYIGSANYSAESKGNYECGVLFSDPDVILRIREEIVEQLVEASVPNDMSDIAKAKVLIRSLHGRLSDLVSLIGEGLFRNPKFTGTFRWEDAEVSSEILEQIETLIEEIESEMATYADHPMLHTIHELLSNYQIERIRELMTVDDPLHRLSNWNDDAEPESPSFPYDEDLEDPSGEIITVTHPAEETDYFRELLEEIVPAWEELTGTAESIESTFVEMLAELDRLEKTNWDINNT